MSELELYKEELKAKLNKVLKEQETLKEQLETDLDTPEETLKELEIEIDMYNIFLEMV